MSLTRVELEQDRTRYELREGVLGAQLWSEAQLDQSLAQTFVDWDGQSDVWIFGYGSLIWNPQFLHAERREGRLRGFHRRLCLWSRINRGTPDCPGLVLGLEPGGQCRGMVFRISAQDVERESLLLWRREMLMGSYVPRWVTVRTDVGPVRALTFVVCRHSSGYAGKLCDADTLSVLRQAKGRFGSSQDYLCSTHAALESHGIRDHYLARLCAEINA